MLMSIIEMINRQQEVITNAPVDSEDGHMIAKVLFSIGAGISYYVTLVCALAWLRNIKKSQRACWSLSMRTSGKNDRLRRSLL